MAVALALRLLCAVGIAMVGFGFIVEETIDCLLRAVEIVAVLFVVHLGGCVLRTERGWRAVLSAEHDASVFGPKFGNGSSWYDQVVSLLRTSPRIRTVSVEKDGTCVKAKTGLSWLSGGEVLRVYGLVDREGVVGVRVSCRPRLWGGPSFDLGASRRMLEMVVRQLGAMASDETSSTS